MSESDFERLQGNLVGRLHDASGATAFRLYDSAGVEIWTLDSDGHHQDVTIYQPLPMLPTTQSTAVEWGFSGWTAVRLQDGETLVVPACVPARWDGVSDLTVAVYVANGTTEDIGDIIDLDVTIRPWSGAGEQGGFGGVSGNGTLVLDANTRSSSDVNRVEVVVAYDDSSYPISPGDALQVKLVANLGGSGEATGPLYLLSWRIEATANKLGG